MQTPEGYLKDYIFLKNSYESAEKKLMELFIKKQNYVESMLRSSFPEGIRVQKTRNNDAVFEVVAKISEFYDKKILEAGGEVEKLRTQIYEKKAFLERCGLNENEKKYVDLRFKDIMTHLQIAATLHISERAVYYIRKSLLNKICRNL